MKGFGEQPHMAAPQRAGPARLDSLSGHDAARPMGWAVMATALGVVCVLTRQGGDWTGEP